jgi:hypothetical protein
MKHVYTEGRRMDRISRMSELTLEQLLDRKVWPAKPVRLMILRQIAQSLDQAHLAGKLHGNLSPRRVLVKGALESGTPEVRVVDFGTRFSPDHELVIGESVPEPARFMSPERILGIDMNARSDQFSLGLIAYYMVCARPAFDAETVSPLFYQVCAEQPPAPEDVDPTLSRAVGKVFARVLAKDAGQRFSTCSAFVDALTLSVEDCEGWAEPTGAPGRQAMAVAAAAGTAATVSGTAATAPAGAPIAATATAIENAPPVAQADTMPIAPPAFDYSARRRRRMDPDDSPEKIGPRRDRTIGWVWIAATIIALSMILAALLWSQHRKPELPVQVADTRNAPMTPPPPDVQTPPAKPLSTTPPAASSPPPAPKTNAPEAHNAPPAPAQMGEPAEPIRPYTGVAMSTQPAGASIIVDGDVAKSCITPCTMSLSRGRHTLRAEFPGYSVAQRVFQVPGEIPVNITLAKQTGTLVVTSYPSGEAVFVDGRQAGTTPATLQLSPGPHEVAVSNGTGRQAQTVTVQADAIQAKRFTW